MWGTLDFRVGCLWAPCDSSKSAALGGTVTGPQKIHMNLVSQQAVAVYLPYGCAEGNKIHVIAIQN